MRDFIENELNLDAENIWIERAHRIGEKIKNDENNYNRTIVVRFLSYKDKNKVLEHYREKKLWEKKFYINEDFSDETIELRKELFKKVKKLREKGKFAKLVYNKIITHEWRGPRKEDISEHLVNPTKDKK